jgi:hypothetical protein
VTEKSTAPDGGDPNRLTAAREALLAALPTLNPDSDNFKAVGVLTFEPKPMRDIKEAGGLKDTCYNFLNSCAERGLVNKFETEGPKKYSLKKEGEIPEKPDEPDDLTAHLECHLRDYIKSNLQTINVNGLPLRLVGVEYRTDVGRIDILAQDINLDFVVFELKRDKVPDCAVGQTLRYMGWVSKNLAAGKKVWGVIIAHDIDEKLKYAVSLVPSITVFEYKLSFSLNKVALG